MLLSLPIFRHLRERHPHICLAARPDIGEFFRQTGSVDDSVDVGNSLFLSLHERAPDEQLRSFLGQYDFAYVFSANREARAAECIRQVIAQTVSIHTIPPEDSKEHVTGYRIRQMPEPVISPSVLPVLPESSFVRARELLASGGIAQTSCFISIHPGSGAPKKNWPLEKYFLIAERLRNELSSPIVFLSGPAEGTVHLQTINAFAGKAKNTIHLQGLSLLSLAALMTMTRLYIGNDSGATHLAASAGAPVLALFGPTDPLLWSPLGSRIQIVQSETSCMDTITADQVFSAAHSILDNACRKP